MSQRIKVGFKYCGNCNPYVATRDIYREIKLKTVDIDSIEFVGKDDPGLDILIVLSGCPIDCAERPKGKYREIVVAGETVDGLSYASKEIANIVLKKMMLKNGER